MNREIDERISDYLKFFDEGSTLPEKTTVFDVLASGLVLGIEKQLEMDKKLNSIAKRLDALEKGKSQELFPNRDLGKYQPEPSRH
ncbi:MAG: hypothetical protein FWE47_04245 [Oscillospiraceae bacterium]|nr:hypothetical protein [Oscillospiraceae bacterium]